MENEKSTRGNKQLINLGIIVLLILLTFYILHKNIGGLNFKYIYSIFIHLKIQYVILALLSMVLFIVIEGQCLAVIAKPLGYRISLKEATVYAAADLYFSAITPSATGGQPASAYYMVKDGVKASDATTILVINILQYTISLIILGTIGFLAEFDFFADCGTALQVLFIFGFALQIVLVVICLMCMFSKSLIKRLQSFLVKIIYKFKFIKHKDERALKIDHYIAHYQVGVDFVRKKPGIMAVVLGGNLLQRIAFFSIGYFIYRSLGLDSMSYWEIIAIQSLLAVAVNSLPVPGAIGVSEGGFLLLFKTIYPDGLLAPAMVFTRGINYYLCFILCGIFTIIYHISIVRREGKGRNK